MKQNLMPMLFAVLFSTISLTSCQKEEIVNPAISQRVPENSIGTWTHTETCAGENLTVTFCNQYGNNCGNTKIQRWNGTEWVQVANDTPTAGCLSYTIANATAGEYRFRGSWTRTGNPNQCSGENTGWVEYTAEVVSCGCDDELSAEVTCTSDACNRSVTFTYTAGDDVDAIVIQGGLTRFTTICTATATGGLVQNTTHSSVTNSNANVTRWEATGVEECDEYTVTITWTSTNNDPLITGQWTVQDGDGHVLAYVCPLDCAGASAETCE